MVANQLSGVGHPYEYESEKLDYIEPEKSRKYNPDFILTKKDGSKMYIESKGRFLTKDRQKHLLLRDQHDHDIRFVFQRATNKISKTSNTTYAKWCDSKGFKWSDKGIIPKEWLEE